MPRSCKQSGILVTLIIAAALVLGAGSARALTDSVWTNTAGGLFSDPNWDPGSPPANRTNDVAWFGLAGQTYTVTFGANSFAYGNVFTGANQNVTFDLGGFTYSHGGAYLNNPNPPSPYYVGTMLRIGSNATDSVTLTVENGTITAGTGANYPRIAMAGTSSLIVSNGGKVITGYMDYDSNIGKQLILTDPGSYMEYWHGPGSMPQTTMVLNAASAFFSMSGAPGQVANSLLLIDNASVTNSGGNFLIFGGTTIRVQNGGILRQSAGTTLLGQQSGSDSRLIVGNDGPVSVVDQIGIRHEEAIPAQRANTEVIVSTNGIVKIRGGTPAPMYATATTGTWGRADWRLQDNSIITLRGGAIAMNTNTAIGIADNNTTTSIADPGTSMLRGYGTISNYNAGANFRVLNHGVIRPGDIGVESGAISANTAGIGTISLVGGDLLMTNPLTQVASAIYFDFDPATAGAADLIDVTGGTITVTGGSNVFNNFTGATQLAFGTWDFLKADSILYTPEFDNLTNIINGLTNTIPSVLFAGYTYGVVQDGDYSVLRLSVNMIPEPSTVLLLLGGGLLVWRSRKRH